MYCRNTGTGSGTLSGDSISNFGNSINDTSIDGSHSSTIGINRDYDISNFGGCGGSTVNCLDSGCRSNTAAAAAAPAHDITIADVFTNDISIGVSANLEYCW